MTELQIIERLRSRFGVTGRGVVLGIGDDCAIFRPVGSPQDLVFTTDQMIEGVSFPHGSEAFMDRGEGAGTRAQRHRSDGSRSAFLPGIACRSPTFRSRRVLPRSGTHRRSIQHPRRRRRSGTFALRVMRCCGLRLRAARHAPCAAMAPDQATPFTYPVLSDDLPFANIGISRSHESRGAEICEDSATAGMDLSDGLSLDLHRLMRRFRRQRFSVQRPGSSRRDARTGAARRRRLRVVVYRPEFAWARNRRHHSRAFRFRDIQRLSTDSRRLGPLRLEYSR